jgi:anti-anti-sigma regulatory factor
MFEDKESLAGLRAYASFAKANMKRISELNAAAYAGVASFGPMMSKLRGDAMLAQNLANIDKIAAAASSGDWEQYLATLRERGISYAKQGMDFASWTTAFQRMFNSLIDLLFDSVPDREELRVMLKGTSELFDVIVQVVGQTFFDAQQSTMRALGTPILLADDRLLLVPLVGELGDDRLRDLTSKLLAAVRVERARAVVVDLTGVPSVDSNAMAMLTRVTSACSLMGARVVISGLMPSVCRSLVTLGVAFPADVETVGSLHEALDAARAPRR